MKFRYQLYRHNTLNNYFTLVDTEVTISDGKPYILIQYDIKEIYREYDNDNKWYYADKDELYNHTLYFEFNNIEKYKDKFMEYLI